ncbi:hypothetical protein U1Q18_022223 [Sarracenia purpurea var. burkii]
MWVFAALIGLILVLFMESQMVVMELILHVMLFLPRFFAAVSNPVVYANVNIVCICKCWSRAATSDGLLFLLVVPWSGVAIAGFFFVMFSGWLGFQELEQQFLSTLRCSILVLNFAIAHHPGHRIWFASRASPTKTFQFATDSMSKELNAYLQMEIIMKSVSLDW